MTLYVPKCLILYTPEAAVDGMVQVMIAWLHMSKYDIGANPLESVHIQGTICTVLCNDYAYTVELG